MSQILIPAVTALLGLLGGLAAEWVRRRWTKQSAAEELIRKYRDPLLQAAFGLQSRLYNIVHMSFLDFAKSGSTDEQAYARDSTLWHFAEYLGWTEILRREVQFLDLGTVSKNKSLQERFGAIASALASDNKRYWPIPDTSDGEPSTDPPEFMVFRDDQRAIGEMMVTERPLPDETKTGACLDYGEFVKKVEGARSSQKIDPFSRWCRRFEADLGNLAGEDWDSRHPRLIEIQRRLIDLVDLLDPKQERFPNRDSRGKLRGGPSEVRPGYRIARFIDATIPTPTVDKWAKKHGLWAELKGRLYRRRRWGLGVELVVSVLQDDGQVSIAAWTRPPLWLRGPGSLVGLLGSGVLPSESDRGNMSLERNGLLFWNSRRRARNATNDLLRRFDRPIVVADSIARRQWAVLLALCSALVLLLGWPGWVRTAVAAPAKATQSGTAPTTDHPKPPSTSSSTAAAPVSTPKTGTTVVTSTVITTVTNTLPVTVTTGAGIVDAIAPVATIALPGNTRSWRDLAGSVADRAPTAGLRGVEVSIVRIGRSRCSAYTGFGFSRLACGEAFRVWLSAHVSGDRWSFRLRVLPPGEYVFRARATDAAGNQQRPPAARFISLTSTR